MPKANSVAYSLVIPGGIVCDPADQVGQSLMLVDLLSKGAGPYDSRALNDRIDFLGMEHVEFAAQDHFGLQGCFTRQQLVPALELIFCMITSARLEERYLDVVRNVLCYDFAALGDDCTRKCFGKLGQNFFKEPYDRPLTGTPEGLAQVTGESLRRRYKNTFRPTGTILSVAGGVEVAELLDAVERFTGNWSGTAEALPLEGEEICQTGEVETILQGPQAHVILAYPAAGADPETIAVARVVHQLLSGDFCGRLFREIRDKRGLCYAVNCRHVTAAAYAATFAHAVTNHARIEEVSSLLKSIIGDSGMQSDKDFEIAKSSLRGYFVRQHDSVAARAIFNARACWLTGRVIEIEQSQAEIDKVNNQQVVEYIQKYLQKPLFSLTGVPQSFSSEGAHQKGGA